jgi:cation transport ATPase
MSSHNADWQLQMRGVEFERGKILDLESRVDWSERVVSQHEHDIKQTHYEVASKSAHLEKQIASLEKRIKRSERLIVLLSDIMIALIAVLFAGLVAAYLHGNITWKGFGALTAFVAIFFAGISVSRGYWLK